MSNFIKEYEFKDICVGGNDRAIEITRYYSDGRTSTSQIPLLQMTYGKAGEVVEFLRDKFSSIISVRERKQYEDHILQRKMAVESARTALKMRELDLAEAEKDLEEFDSRADSQSDSEGGEVPHD